MSCGKPYVPASSSGDLTKGRTFAAEITSVYRPVTMASSRSIVDYIVAQLGPDASARAMFGEYGVYLRGTLIALVCDDRLFLKSTDAAAAILGRHERASPYPGAKPAIVVPEDDWSNTTLMQRLATANATALAQAKPAPKPRRVAKPTKRVKPR